MNSFHAFDQCLVDGDPEVLRRDRRSRRLGFIVSVALQTALLAVLVLLPLFVPAALPRLFNLVQIPPVPAPALVRVADHAAQPASSSTPLYVLSSPVRPLGFAHRSRPSDASSAPLVATGPAGSSDPLAVLRPSAEAQPAPPAPRESAHAPIQKSSGVMQGLLLERLEPVYPAVAVTARISGSVVLDAVISTDGTVRSLRVVSGNAILAGAALAAVRNWRYRPTLLNGRPVEVETLVTVDFRLD